MTKMSQQRYLTPPGCIPKAGVLKLLTSDERLRFLVLLCRELGGGNKPLRRHGDLWGLMHRWLHGPTGEGPMGSPPTLRQQYRRNGKWTGSSVA